MKAGDETPARGPRRCGRCGVSLEQSDRFCSSCGAAASPPSTQSGTQSARSPARPSAPPAPATAPLPPVSPRPSLEAPRSSETNGLAVASLVLGILWLGGLGSLLAIVFGIKGRNQIDASDGRQGGRGLAIAGIALGVTGVGGLTLLVILVLAASSTTHAPLPSSLAATSAPLEGASTVSSTPTESTAAQPTASFTPTTTWTWDTKNTDGYTAHYELGVQAPVSLSSVPILPGFHQQSDISGACSEFNATTDALLPVRLTLTNTTASFKKDVSTFFSLPLESTQAIEVVTGYSAGVECKDMQGRNAGNEQSDWPVDCELAPNASCTNYSYLILKNFYSPSAPKGATSALSALDLEVEATTPTSSESFTHVSGPGAKIMEPVVSIPLSG
jgi:hypothetical protein